MEQDECDCGTCLVDRSWTVVEQAIRNVPRRSNGPTNVVPFVGMLERSKRRSKVQPFDVVLTWSVPFAKTVRVEAATEAEARVKALENGALTVLSAMPLRGLASRPTVSTAQLVPDVPSDGPNDVPKFGPIDGPNNVPTGAA